MRCKYSRFSSIQVKCLPCVETAAGKWKKGGKTLVTLSAVQRFSSHCLVDHFIDTLSTVHFIADRVCLEPLVILQM